MPAPDGPGGNFGNKQQEALIGPLFLSGDETGGLRRFMLATLVRRSDLTMFRSTIPAVMMALFATQTLAGPLSGKSYIIQMTSSAMDSGYANYLVPPLAAELAKSGMKAMRGPGADLAVTINTDEDVGQWVTRNGKRQWLYTFSVTVGLSPADADIPDQGPPVFGVRATLMTPSSGRDDELACLIHLAAAEAIARYKPTGLVKVDGSRCLGR